MNFLGGRFGNLGLASQPLLNQVINFRQFSVSATTLGRTNTEKYYKLTKYTKKIKEVPDLQVGQPLPRGIKIPLEPSKVPIYHYETRAFKRQNRGLYGGLQRKTTTYRSEFLNKTLSYQLPNIQRTKLWSETLKKSIQTRVSTKVLKTIDREGGLDKYLTKDKPARIKTLGLLGWKLRYQVLRKQTRKRAPVVKVNDKKMKVKFIHPDGRRFLVGKTKLLEALYNVVKRDSYYPIPVTKLHKDYGWWSEVDIIAKLEKHNYDFSKITA